VLSALSVAENAGRHILLESNPILGTHIDRVESDAPDRSTSLMGYYTINGGEEVGEF